ncbi:MAG: cellulase family glycosylhydrolase [Thermoguttaceae bacterium]
MKPYRTLARTAVASLLATGKPLLHGAGGIIALLLAAAAMPARAAGPHPSLPLPGTTDGLGVNIHFTDPRPGEMQMLAEGGFRWVRMDFTWAGTEREKGRYDFSAYDRLLTALEPHRIRALFILDYSNSLYEMERSVTTEEGRQAYARWAAAAAEHFRGRGVLWEIWNEPNIAGFWKPAPNVEDYAPMALAAARAIRNATPGEAIIGPATSTIDLEFLEGCFKAGLLQWWDAVSVHPYRQSTPESAAVEYHRLRRLIARYAPADRSIPIVSGEWGYSSAWNGFDPARQGQMLARQWLTNLSQEIPVSIWYDWHDDGLDPQEAEHHFGSVLHQYNENRQPVYDAKPAYLAARTLTTTLAGYRFSKRITVGKHDTYALLFQKADQQRLAVWTTAAEPTKVRIPSRDARFEQISHTGETRSSISATNGYLEVTATGSPQYLIAGAPRAVPADAPTAHALHATLAAGPGRVVAVHVDNLENVPFQGTARLTDVGGIEPAGSQQPLQLSAGQSNRSLRFPLSVRPVGECQVGLRIEDPKGNLMYEVPSRRFVYLPDQVLTTCQAVADGDAQGACNVSVAVAQAPQPLPDSDTAVLRIDYQFDPGWKFLRLVPKAGEPAELAGKPTGFAFWIFGDGHSTSPRLRVRDATGQTWQPSGQTIDWQGWRYVELPLTASSGHWGGAADHVIHYPLTWDSLFLLDNPSRTKNEGSIYLAAPMVLY